MRQIFLDTETTGLDAEKGDRIIEIGCVEMVNRKLTGNNWHHYLNPDRDSHEEALKVHGLTTEFLQDKPRFEAVAESFLEYVQGAETAHRVAFAEGTFNPVAQMGNPDCFNLFTKEELDAIQWDSLEEEMSRCVEYDIVPDYDKLLDIMTAAKREASGG